MASPQFQQLPMFMSAREIRSRYAPWPFDRYEVETPIASRTPLGIRDETDPEFWARKRHEASLGVIPTLDQQILKDGVHTPVSLESPGKSVPRDPYVLGGHHRIAVMSEHKPDALMPVEHFPSGKAARAVERARQSAESR